MVAAEFPFNQPDEFLTWFEPGTTLVRVRTIFEAAQHEIRIACGFFTLRGWGLIRRFTVGKQVYILVGLDDPGEGQARQALIKEIMRDLATGLDIDRRQAVLDLVAVEYGREMQRIPG